MEKIQDSLVNLNLNNSELQSKIDELKTYFKIFFKLKLKSKKS